MLAGVLAKAIRAGLLMSRRILRENDNLRRGLIATLMSVEALKHGPHAKVVATIEEAPDPINN